MEKILEWRSRLPAVADRMAVEVTLREHILIIRANGPDATPPAPDGTGAGGAAAREGPVTGVDQ